MRSWQASKGVIIIVKMKLRAGQQGNWKPAVVMFHFAAGWLFIKCNRIIRTLLRISIKTDWPDMLLQSDK
jgi:hypothetical protein